MPFVYQPGRSGDRLMQGELLSGIIEYVPLQPPTPVDEGTEIPVRAVRRDKMVVLTQDCDLAQDFGLRSPDNTLTALLDVEDETGSVPSVLLCQAFEDLRSRVSGGDVFRRAKQNQDERYHTLPESPIGDTAETLPALYLDFRKFVALSTPFLYQGLSSGGVVCLGVIPPVYLHDVVHRFHGYLSRVAVDAD